MAGRGNREYWNRRALVDKARIINNAEKYLQEHQEKLYGAAEKEIQAEVEKLYQKFADQQKVSLAEARRLIRDADFRRIDWDSMVKYAVDNHKELKAARDKMPGDVVAAMEKEHMAHERKLAAYTARGKISYLELRQVEIDKKLLDLYDVQQINLYNLLHSEYDDGHYRQVYNIQQHIGFGHDFIKPNAAAVDKAILNQYQRQNFSQTLYAHYKHFSKDLKENLVTGIIRGENLDRMARRIHQRMGVSQSAAKRLVRTETAYIYEQATKDAYEECGIEEYEYLATLDNRTSEMCRELDGKHFKVRDALPGKNYPPMHPNCRSTTVCYFPDEKEKKKQATRLAKDENGKYYDVPADMTYNQWQNKYGTGIMRAQGDGTQEDAPKPQLLFAMEKTDRDSCIKKLKELEKEIENQDYETAYVISKGGKAYRIDGESASVNINGLPKRELYNAYMTHNHPPRETRYSFSSFDISEAMRNRFSELRGFDDQFEYSISFRKDTKFEEADVIQHRFTTDFYYAVLDDVMSGAEIDMDLDEYHEINKRMAEEYRYDYERKPRRAGGTGEAQE